MSVPGRSSRLPRDLALLYADCPFPDRVQIALRWRTCPFEAVAAFAPAAGAQLEVGCGRGLLANLLALRSPGRAVTGLDPDPRRVEIARRTVGARGNIAFGLGEAPPPGGHFGAIFLVDVLYLLSDERRRRLLSACRDALAGEGILLVKTMARRPRWKAALDRLQESLAVRALGWTRGEAIVPPDPAALSAELEALGLRVETVPLDRGFPHPHLLFVAALAPSGDARS
ncbi:MAG TPA: class I SAM-dependent methyltransferase [Planctomycetota bacterium]|nr:class I SAM-dependent methyltransferase [Planctomycetota bacterium]